MVRLREIQRTAAFTWSPGPGNPILVTGTRAGAVDDDFSAESKLELWDLNLDGQESGQELSPIISLSIDSRFYDIAWGPSGSDHPAGIIAGALENGSLDMWDAERLLNGQSEAALISRTTKHTGPVKALQFNPQRPNIIATAGFKGELFVYDTNEPSNAFRLGTAAARADDLECLAWNRIVPHILATGGVGGFVMVWDLKTKKASWTLNNRKPVSAIAWDPNNSTKLLVATPDDNNPAILLWDLRNSNAPERTLQGHDQGILSLSWCARDSDLLLSCGKDNKTMMWNPQTGEKYGEFPESTNWTFSTSFNPQNPSIIATASFDGKIVVQTVQNTNSQAGQGTANNNLDGEEFFSTTQSQPLGPSFTLTKAPSWLARPVGASFGFGGKLVVFRPATAAQAGQKKTSQLSISQFSVDSDVGSATEGFENSVKSGDIPGICKDRADKARTEDEKADWLVMETLAGSNPRERIPGYLGFQKEPDSNENNENAAESTDGPSPVKPKPRGHAKKASFFETSGDGSGGDSDDFLSAAKGAKTDNPFHILSDGDTTIEKEITQALLVGDFAKATDLCLQEGRMTDAFLIANCGGPELVEKVQAAYLAQKEGYPSYLRLLGSVLDKNLWDVVYNSDLSDWKEAMVILCTYSDNSEFPDLCEALGDRILEKGGKKDASFCYLVGSKLDKVVSIWITELEEAEKVGVEDTTQGSTFSVHARYLQQFIEKVTVFRHVTNFEDDEKELLTGWKLAPLYDKYTEYADIVAAHGQLAVAQKYLDLLPNKYPAAEVARNRVRLATQKTTPKVPAKQTPTATAAAARGAPSTYHQQAQATPPPSYGQTMPPSSNSYGPQGHAAPAPSNNPYAPTGSAAPASSTTPYAPPGGASAYQPPGVAPNPYQPAASTAYAPAHGGYQPPHAPTSVPGYGGAPAAYGVPPPPRAATPSMAPPSRSRNMDNWNDVPLVTKAPPRRNTPSVAPVTSPFPGQQNAAATGPPQSPYTGSGMGSPVPPPPKGPPRVTSPRSDPHASSSTTSSSYAPPPPSQGSVPPTMAAQMVSRTGSPYNPPPSASAAGAPQANRYAPAPAAQQQSQAPIAGPPGGTRPPPPAANPYGNPSANQFAPSPYAPAHGQPVAYGIPPPGPTPGPVPGPPPQRPPKASAPQPTPPPPKAASPQQPKHPAGDRSHLTPEGRKIYELFEGDFRNVAAKAPPTFLSHVKDTEKRLNFLFDHLNNGELLTADTIDQLGLLAEALAAKNYDEAQRLQLDIQKNKTEECGNWMVGVKRLITLSKNTL